MKQFIVLVEDEPILSGALLSIVETLVEKNGFKYRGTSIPNMSDIGGIRFDLENKVIGWARRNDMYDYTMGEHKNVPKYSAKNQMTQIIKLVTGRILEFRLLGTYDVKVFENGDIKFGCTDLSNEVVELLIKKRKEFLDTVTN